MGVIWIVGNGRFRRSSQLGRVLELKGIKMKIFLTPLDAEGQEGEASKPFRFIVSFMHSEYDPKKYGFEKFALELDAGATKGKLRLIKGIQDSDSLERGDVVVDEEKPYGKGFPRVIREYSFEEFVCTPMGIRFDNCVRI